MMSDEDPFTLVQARAHTPAPIARAAACAHTRVTWRARLSQEEVSAQLIKVSAQMARWKELSASANEMDNTEGNQMKVQLTTTLNELQQDLQDLQATVDIAAKDPDKFGIAPAELKRRGQYVSKTRAEVSMYSETLSNFKSAAKMAKAARKERSDRQGLLSNTGSSSCDMASSAAAGVEALASQSAQQRDAYSQHDQVIQQQQQMQQAAVVEQDEQLGVLSSVMFRLGDMGKQIKEELIAQGKALDELTEDVDTTQGKMAQATAVMNKMLKSKDGGKFCFIIFLTVVLGLPGWSKWPSWRGQSWPPRAHQSPSEGLGLPSALVRRGPASQMPSRGRGSSSQSPPKLTFSLRLTTQACCSSSSSARDEATSRRLARPVPFPSREACHLTGRVVARGVVCTGVWVMGAGESAVASPSGPVPPPPVTVHVRNVFMRYEMR